MFESYLGLVQYVREHSTDKEEIARIEEEIRLFEERGWEEYVLFLANLLPRLNKSEALPFLSKSALDSYFLYKAENGSSINQDRLRNDKAKGILFNDALRLDIKLVWMRSYWEEKIRVFNDIFKSEIKKHGLFSSERQTLNTKDDVSETVILSTSEIPEKDVEIIMNEKPDSTGSESGILRKYLIIRISIHNGI